MKSFTNVAAQGEVTIRRLGPVPANRTNQSGFTPMVPEKGKFIIGHSETGHNHVIDAAHAGVSVMDKPPEGMRILRMILERPTTLDHLRGHDTHEAIVLDPGEYDVRIAREYDHYAELARQSAD